MKRRTALLALTSLAAALLLGAHGALAQEVTLKIAHFLPPNSTAQTKFIEPWCAKINKESHGRLKCQIYPAMQLGGSPPQLFDQAKDGVADIVWTVPGYQSGRFMVSEAFELPFLFSSAEKGSRALWAYATKNAQNEFKGVKPIVFHLHDGAQLHTTHKQIKTLADFKGLKLRGPTRLGTKLIAAFGATPVSMPVPAVPESMSKGVIDGAMLPWEIVPTIKVDEIAKFHTETAPGMPKMSNTVFIFGMNQAKYDSLPADLKKVIDDNSGPEVSAGIGKVWDATVEPARKLALARGNSIYVLPADEYKAWEKAAEGISAEWVKDVTAKGYDGAKLLGEVKALAAAK